MGPIKTAFLHYSAPPVVGGVEAVINAHADVFLAAGYPVRVIAGQGDAAAMPLGIDLRLIPEMDTQHPVIRKISAALERGIVPPEFHAMSDYLAYALRPIVHDIDVLLVHNVFTKHFNLPLTAALARLVEDKEIPRCIAWCHDLTWTSSHSRPQVFPGYPWDLLRTPLSEMVYIAISNQRRLELAKLFNFPDDEIKVIYNGVDPAIWFGLSPEGLRLVQEMDILVSDIILLMPVRITQAKNIELAAHVVKSLVEKGCNPRLIVTGPPDPHSADSMRYYDSLRDVRGALHLEKNIRFVYEMQSREGEPLLIDQRVAADLLRVSDVVFLPSHREGFGMPVLEAGLIGVPVASNENIPAAMEIGEKDIFQFDLDSAPEKIASLLLEQAINTTSGHLRRKVRHNFTWERIFYNQIEPLLRQNPHD